jgi:hypothetical protein
VTEWVYDITEAIGVSMEDQESSLGLDAEHQMTHTPLLTVLLTREGRTAWAHAYDHDSGRCIIITLTAAALPTLGTVAAGSISVIDVDPGDSLTGAFSAVVVAHIHQGWRKQNITERA